MFQCVSVTLVKSHVKRLDQSSSNVLSSSKHSLQVQVSRAKTICLLNISLQQRDWRERGGKKCYPFIPCPSKVQTSQSLMSLLKSASKPQIWHIFMTASWKGSKFHYRRLVQSLFLSMNWTTHDDVRFFESRVTSITGPNRLHN